VVDSGGKADFGGLEGVVCASASEHRGRGDQVISHRLLVICRMITVVGGLTGREVKVEEKDTAGIRRVTGAHDGRLPVEQAVTDRAGAAGRRWVSAEVGQFLRNDKKRYGQQVLLYNRVGVGRWR
jgi:hypothetical protein